MARAPKLSGQPESKINGDVLVATYGLRDYHIKAYEKQGRMFTVREIYNCNIFFEVSTK